MPLSADSCIDLIKHIRARGLDLHEAVDQFDDRQLSDAIFTGGPVDDDQRALLSIVAQAYEQKSNIRDLDDAIELWLAGWKSEPGNPPRRIFSWYWRRPPIGKRPVGRLFLSTQQALNALRKEKLAGE